MYFLGVVFFVLRSHTKLCSDDKVGVKSFPLFVWRHIRLLDHNLCNVTFSFWHRVQFVVPSVTRPWSRLWVDEEQGHVSDKARLCPVACPLYALSLCLFISRLLSVTSRASSSPQELIWSLHNELIWYYTCKQRSDMKRNPALLQMEDSRLLQMLKNTFLFVDYYVGNDLIQ